MQIDDGQDPNPNPDGTRDQRTPASDGRLGAVLRTMVVERSSGEETVTSSMRVGQRPSGEVHASFVHMRRSGPILQLIELRRMYSSSSPSEYRALARTDTEVIDPVMNNMTGGPSVDRTLTGEGETLALTSSDVVVEPRGDPIMVESFTTRVGAATQDSKVEQSSDGQGRPPIRWGQGIQIRPSKNLPQTFDSSSRPAATLLPISPAEVSEAISKLQREKARIQRNLDQKKAEHGRTHKGKRLSLSGQ
jgi:hypothetical protein